MNTLAPRPLDLLYAAYASQPSTDSLNSLLAEVRRVAKRSTHDDDAAQEVCIYVLEQLDRFIVRGPQSFSSWIRTIIRRRRMRLVDAVVRDRKHDYLGLNGDLYDPEVSEFKDFSSLPEGLQSIALELHHGDSLDEVADRRGVKPNSIYKKVMRSCPEIAPSDAQYIEG